ncbi:threonine ammonia-lyase IlvA [Arsenicicoccus dermatophilus]|uniref:threonine ammonia-lyase IlvA n=1 Tax=Arsenicicoccus dermatophilus TaxID=1076331 RepID=UPI001F4CC0D9|nr:threonine ammonia-lyase IlvA [Arsenicicoccus dermatophilus]MCH8611945.1 threonine ammonia-lyase IlvA [Arsenicicoccus dermatophilus]
MTLADTLAESQVTEAATLLAGVVERTPLQPNARLGERIQGEVWLKREDLQPVRSYKLRGAYSLVARLDPSERAAGVVCASAGNHGQGVAFACRELGIRARIFVPTTTPRQKRDRMRALGGDLVELVVTGDTYDEAAGRAAVEATVTGATVVPAFDHPRTIAGQGTVAAEVVDQLGRAPDVLLVPVGGAGMLAGCLTWLAEHHPATRVVAVEPAGAACLAAALAAGEPVTLPAIDTFVDGAAVRRVGDTTLAVVQAAIAKGMTVDLAQVPEGKVCTEMLDLYQVDGVIAEPAGALATAALGGGDRESLVTVEPGRTVVAVVSGGNNDVPRYSETVERSLVYEGRKHYFLVSFPQEPGALRRFLDEVLGPDDDITLFEYVKRSNREIGPALVGLELGRAADLPGLLARLESSPIGVERVDPASPFYRFLV